MELTIENKELNQTLQQKAFCSNDSLDSQKTVESKQLPVLHWIKQKLLNSHYNQGNLNLSRDERHQLGVRIASEMSLDTIFSIDATPMLNDLDKIDEDYVNALWED